MAALWAAIFFMTLTAPAFLPVWARSSRWLTFASQLTRYYTNRAGLNAWTLLLLRPNDDAIAWAQPSTRTIGLNPSFPAATGPLTLDRTPAPTLAHLTETNLRAYLAHEAGHVRFSCARPEQPTLGRLWNSIEDERIERKMTAQHPQLNAVFTTVGDIHLQQLVNVDRPEALCDAPLLDWCLTWRWGHDHPLFNDRPADPLWKEIRPILEAAWDAPCSEDVIEAARVILGLLGTPPEEQQPPDPRVTATGGDSPQREEPKKRPPAPQKPQEEKDQQNSDKSKQETPESADQKQDKPEGQHDDQSGSGEEEGESGTGEDSDESEGDPGDEGQPDDGQDDGAESDEAGSGDGDDTENDPSGNEQGDTSSEGDQDESDAQSPSSGPGTPSDADSSDEAGQSQSGDGDPLSDPVAPEDLSSPDTSGEPQNGPSQGHGGSWDGPQMAHRTPGALLITDHEAFARVLVPLISAKDNPGMDVSDRTRGRFSFERYQQKADRVFRRRTLPTRQRPVLITVLADVSGSTGMDWCGQTCAQGIATATTAFARAGMLANLAAEVYTFESSMHVVAGRNLSPRQAYEHVRTYPFEPLGNTRLAPALQQALSRRTPDARHLVVIISDGQLREQDTLECRSHLGRHRSSPAHLAFLPLLVNSDAKALHHWRSLFPQARPASSPVELINLTRSLLNSLQQSYWRSE
jgi:hypothetical protein